MALNFEALDEESVWNTARTGDSDSFGAIFDLHRDRVFRHAARLMASKADAEDIAALVFLELWRRRKAVRVVNGSVLAWLLVVTNNVAHNTARAKQRHARAIKRIEDLLGSDDVSSAGADSGLDATARSQAMGTAFASLSERDQDVLTLCVLEEFSMATAAKALGIPAGTVKSRLSRAKQHLASTLSPEFDAYGLVAEGDKS